MVTDAPIKGVPSTDESTLPVTVSVPWAKQNEPNPQKKTKSNTLFSLGECKDIFFGIVNVFLIN
jgi:hypothetical protein